MEKRDTIKGTENVMAATVCSKVIAVLSNWESFLLLKIDIKSHTGTLLSGISLNHVLLENKAQIVLKEKKVKNKDV